VSTEPLSRNWWLLPPGRLHPLWWLGVGSILVVLDYIGVTTQFPTAYVVAVSVAAWYSGRWPAIFLAIAVPVAHVLFLLAGAPAPGSLTAAFGMTSVRGAVILVMGLWFARLSEHERELHRHVRTLEGLLPICMFCKKIRDERGEWERLETFISKRSQAKFSHGFCPACGKEHYADFVDEESFQALRGTRTN